MSNRTLTPSGAGALLEPDGLDEPGFVADTLRLLERQRFCVIRGALPTAADAVATLRRFGPINEAKTRQDGAVIVETQGDDEVFRSNGALPLHKDGLLTGFDVILVGIYCVHFQEVSGGRTYVSDANVALRELPPEDVETLRSNGLEAMAVDASGYYREEFESVWHRFPAFKARPGRAPSLSMGLPHAAGEKESWRVRVADVTRAESDRILAALRDAFLNANYVYYHDWREGDLLLMDNYAVLHGREAFEARRRALANIQVLSEDAGPGSSQA